MKCHELPATQTEDPHGRRLMTLRRWAKYRRGGSGGSFGCSRGHFVDEGGRGRGRAGRLGQVEQGGGQLLLLLQMKVTVRQHLACFVLEVVGADQLVQKVDRRALGFRILHPKVSQVGTSVTGETLASLEPGATQLTDYVLVWVHFQRCMAMKRKGK